MKSITIITPTYKGQDYIERLLKMADENFETLKSKYNDIYVEYIFVNDYPQIPLDLNNQYSNLDVKVIENEVNGGIHKSRAGALAAAKGEYVLFLDQDDEIEENTLLSQVEKIGNYDIIVSNGYRKYSNKKELLYLKRAGLKLTSNEKFYIYGTDLILSPGQCLIKKSSIPREWLENIMQINGCDDLFLWLLMFDKKRKFTYNTERLYYHTESGNNYSASVDKMMGSFMDMCRILEKKRLIDKKKIKVLRRRYELKKMLKGNAGILEKLISILVNLDVMVYTLGYKIGGYY